MLSSNLFLYAFASCCIPFTLSLSTPSFYSSLPPLSLPSSPKPVLVKFGGNAMTTPELLKSFCEDCAYLRSRRVPLVVVHGGGPMITGLLKRLQIEGEFDQETGVRVSSAEVVSAAEMALGSVGKGLAQSISTPEHPAISLSGRDGRLLKCSRTDPRLGNVGTVESVETSLLEGFMSSGWVPVISPIGCSLDDSDDTVFNINADTAAGSIANAVSADLTMFMTDVPGVLDGPGGNLYPSLTSEQIDGLKASGVITGGMIPKVSYALHACEGGGRSVIADGRVEHALVRQVFRFYGSGAVEEEGDGGGTFVSL